MKKILRCPRLPSMCVAAALSRTAAALRSLSNVVFAAESQRDPEELADKNSKFCHVSGVKVHYKSWTTSNHPTDSSEREIVIACHGFGSSLFSYEAFVPMLLSLRKASRVIAFDSPGFGLTSRPPIKALRKYQPAFGASIISKLLPQNATKVIMVGFSMGARSVVAAALSETCPAPCALVLIAPALTPEPPVFKGFKRAIRPVFIFLRLVVGYVAVILTVLCNPLLQLLIRIAVSGVTFWVSGLRLARGDPSTLKQSDLDGYRRPLAARDWARGILHFTRAALLESCSPVKSYSVQRLRSQSPSIPVLIIHGGSDRIISVANSRALRAKLPNSDLHVLPGIGHLPHEGTSVSFDSFSMLLWNFTPSMSSRGVLGTINFAASSTAH